MRLKWGELKLYPAAPLLSGKLAVVLLDQVVTFHELMAI